MKVPKYHSITVLKVQKYQSIVVSSPEASFFFCHPEGFLPSLRPRVLAYILFCKSKFTLRYVKPDLRSRGAGQSSSFDKSVFSVSGLPSSSGIRFPDAEKNTHPGAGRSGIEGKRKRIKVQVMEDALTVVLVIVLCLLLKPLISAILRGMGSSEHRRDR